MSNDFNTTLAAMSAEEKVALLTGSGLWRTASLPQHGIEDIIMTDGTYGVRYSSAQIDGREKWSMDDFISVITQTADRGQRGRARRERGSEALFSTSLPATCFPNGSSPPAVGTWNWCIRWGKRWGESVSKWASGSCSGPAVIFAARRWPGAAMNITPKTRWSAVTLPQR